MTLHFVEPSRLWIVLAAVPMAWVGLRWLGAMSGLRRATAILARVALVALLAALLAGASAVKTTDRLAVVGVVDVSGSVRRFAAANGVEGQDRAWAFLRAASAKRGPDDLIGAVVFDGVAAGLSTPGRSELADRGPDVSMLEGTDIAAAIRLGASMVPPDAAGKLVLFSDGNETTGDALRAAREVAHRAGAGRGAGSLRIDVVPLRYEAGGEVVVESVDSPPTATAESMVNVRVTLVSTGPATGIVRLLREGEAVDLNGPEEGTGRRVELEAGRKVLVLPVQLDPGRVHRFRAIFEPDAPAGGPVVDRLIENNAAESFTITPGKGSVLLVDGVSDGDANGAGSTLARALRESAIAVTVVAPSAFPLDLVALQAYDLVILENVPADALETASLDHLASFVRDLGGGLVMVGGPASFGAGGWRGTPVEPILPVKLDLPERLVVPEMAIVFVLDDSGSMRRTVSGSGRSQQEIANEATIAAIRSLDARDLVGVVAFNKDPEIVVPVGPNSDPTSTISKVRGITPNGGTAIGPALMEAAQMLGPVDAKLKHIVLMSDGKSMSEAELPAMAAEINKQGIRITTIALGDDASVGTMQLMAQNGGGTFYNVMNPNILPRVFLKIVRIVRTPLIREVPFVPVVPPTGSPLVAGLDQPPELSGLTLTQARSEPTVVNAMLTPDGEPLLAHWTVELGQCAAFTSDAHAWAKAWLDWPGYRKFWAQTARVLSRSGSGRMFQTQTRVVGDELKLRIDAVDEAGRPLDQLDVPATVYAPTGTKDEVRLSQTGPGVYEGSVKAREAGSYVAVVKPKAGTRRLTPVITGASVSQGAEYRRLTSNSTLLEQIAAETGGRVIDIDGPQNAGLFDRSGITAREALVPLWRSLLIWLLVVLLVDIGTRRIAWDRWISREMGADLRRAAEDAVRERGGQAQRTLEGLRGRRSRGETAPLSLGEEDARQLAKAAIDRRRARRVAELTAAAPVSPSAGPERDASDDASAPPDSVPDSGLLAAKRRARERFDE